MSDLYVEVRVAPYDLRTKVGGALRVRRDDWTVFDVPVLVHEKPGNKSFATALRQLADRLEEVDFNALP